MKILEMLRMPKYLAITITASAIMAVVYVYTQVMGIVENIDLWFSVIPWYNAILFSAFSVIFGLSIAFQIYVRRQPKVCNVSNAKRFGAGGTASFIPFLVAQCPACASLGVLFLPVGAIAVLTQFGWLITLASIALILFLLNYLGAFRK